MSCRWCPVMPDALEFAAGVTVQTAPPANRAARASRRPPRPGRPGPAAAVPPERIRRRARSLAPRSRGRPRLLPVTATNPSPGSIFRESSARAGQADLRQTRVVEQFAQRHQGRLHVRPSGLSVAAACSPSGGMPIRRNARSATLANTGAATAPPPIRGPCASLTTTTMRMRGSVRGAIPTNSATCRLSE